MQADIVEQLGIPAAGRFIHGFRGKATLPIQLNTRIQFNPNLNGVWFFGAMELVNNITFMSIILAGAALIREREHGTIEHLLVMPLTPFQIKIGRASCRERV